MRTTSRVLPALLLAALAAPGARAIEALDPGRPLGLFSLQSWQTQNGLPQNTVEAIVQTRDGYMWLATQEGLVRFDGARFVTFDRNTTPGMSTNHVTALLEAGDGALWAGTLGGGLLRWQGGLVSAVTSGQGLSGDSVTALAQDREGRIWIGTQDQGVEVLEGDRVRAHALPGLPHPQVRALLVARDGSVWAGTARGLARLREGKVDVFTTAEGLGSDSIYALAEDDRGLWVGTSAGLSRQEGVRFRTFTRTDGLSHDFVRALYVGVKGSVWIGTAGGGLDRWHDGVFDTFTSRDGLPSDTVLSLYASREGALWVGTDGGGLNRLSEGKVTAFGPRQGLSNHDVYTVAGTRAGSLLAGSYQGDVDLLEGTRFRRVVPGAQVGSARVRTLLEDSKGGIWIGNEQGLWHWRQGALTRVTRNEPTVRALAEDAEGTVWVGTDGAGLYHVEEGRLVAFPELRAAQVRDIQPGRGGRLWVGTYTGLSLIENGRVRTFTTRDGLRHDYVRSIYEASDGTLWLGTYGGGLSRFRDGAFVNFGVKEGLLSDVIYAIVEDAGHNLWMTCNRGIFRVSVRDLEAVAEGRAARVSAQAFDESDGMPTRECNGGNPGAWGTADGRMWFATLGGVVMVDPAHSAVNRVRPPVVIDRVLADGVEVVGPGRRAAVPMALQPRPRRLEFQFAGLSFVAPEKVRYRYQLEGYDPGWVDAGTSRTAHYTGLPPRHYRFHVIASNSDGVWNEEGAAWDFSLEPALHERPWFPIAIGLVLMAGAVVLHQWRIHALRRSEQRLQARVADAVAHLKTLSGLLPICAACKKIRDDQGYWEQIEVYIRDHSEAQFSHGLCPTCIRAMYPEFADAVLRDPVES